MKLLIIGNGEMGTKYYNILKDIGGCEAQLTNRISEKEISGMRKDLSGVIICTPYEFHYHYSSIALENDLHVFVEKPVCYSYSEARALANLAKARSKILFVAQVLRYTGSVITAKKILSESLDTIQEINIIRKSIKKKPKPWLLNQKRFLLLFEGIHSIDLVNYLLQQELELKQSKLSYGNNHFEGDTGFTASLETGNIQIQIEHEIVEKEPLNKIQIRGNSSLLTITDYAVLEHNGEVIVSNSTQGALDEAYRSEIKEFLNALNHKPANLCTGEEVLSSMKVIENIYFLNEQSFSSE